MDLVSSFESLRDGLLNLDPVRYCENNLYLDGAPLRLNGNGYKPFADIYRYIGVKALERDNSKPVVIVKGRQVGATTMASALELYFVASGIFGTAGRPPMRIMHCFPQLELVYAYTKTKLNPMISGAVTSTAPRKGNKIKSVVEDKLDSTVDANNSLTYKQFTNGNHIWIESTGINGDRIRGRQLCLDTELPTPIGFRKLKDLKEGDQLFDETGNVCNITKMHPIQESPESYRVTFDDGTTIDACAEHLWTTFDRNERRRKKSPSVKNTKEIRDTLKVCGENNHSIANCAPVQYSKKNLIIDPYLLGLWLGDGAKSGQITTADPEILFDFSPRLIKSSVGIVRSFSSQPSKACNYSFENLVTNLTELGILYNPGKKNRHLGFYNKHIPEIYLQASYEQRLSLLQGLMDSDGCSHKDGRCEFVQVEKRKNLLYQVKQLSESLGIKTRVYKKESWRYNTRYQDKYVLIFKTDLPVFRLKRKLKNLSNKPTTKSSHRFIVSVDPIKSKPMRCITVDSPSHLYLVTRSYIPTHNTVDCMFFDEIQDMRKDALGNATKVLSKAQYGLRNNGIQVYFGTPKQSGTEYWRMWRNSSQQYYHLRCESCEEYFPLYTPGSNEWEKIWIDDNLPKDHPSHGFMVRCTHCEHTQDKRPAAERGKWIGLNPELKKGTDLKFIGFHINQLYMPTFRKWDIIAQKPENHPVNTERAYQNEVLGEFFSGSSAPITAEELYDNCADRTRKFTAAIGINETRKVYAGFDWGQKADLDTKEGQSQGGQSYSCAVILTADGPHMLSVEFATKLKRNDPQTKRDIVEQMFRQYSVGLAVGDVGYANDLTYILQQEHGDKFLGSQATGAVKNHVKYSTDIFPKTIHFERDYYIAELYNKLKKGHIKFPYGDWEKIGWLISHICSMEIKVTQDRSGSLKEHYVKGGTPNDGFMALLNAYLAYKFDITNGFKIINPNQMTTDPTERKKVPAILGYMPRLNRGRKK